MATCYTRSATAAMRQRPFRRTLARLDKNKDGKLTQDEYTTDAFVHGIAKFVGNKDMVVTEDEWDEKQKVVGGPTNLFALKIEKSGEAREMWRYEKGFNGVIPTPLLYQGVLYVVKNGGILTSFEAATGKVIKTGRVEGALGGYSSSPVAAEGHVYLSSEEGKVAVLRAGGEWEVMQVNDLDEPLFATPALSEGQIYLRTGSALYRFGSGATDTVPNLLEIKLETLDRPLSAYGGATDPFFRLFLANAIDVDRFFIGIQKPSQFDSVGHPGIHFFLRRLQPVAGRHDFDDEFRDDRREFPPLLFTYFSDLLIRHPRYVRRVGCAAR